MIASEFDLSQNYPNPFNPSTTIRYAVPIRSRVSLTVYDLLGREVATLVDGVVESGPHQVTLNGDGMASSVYFYRFTADVYTITKKLLVLR